MVIVDFIMLYNQEMITRIFKQKTLMLQKTFIPLANNEQSFITLYYKCLKATKEPLPEISGDE